METKSLWFTATTINNYELKVARDLKAMTENRNLTEIESIIVPMEEYTTAAKGLLRERPKYPSYFYVKLQVDGDDQPSTATWYIIRNIKGSMGILHGGEGYMLGMTHEEFKDALNITDEDIATMAKNL